MLLVACRALVGASVKEAGHRGDCHGQRALATVLLHVSPWCPFPPSMWLASQEFHIGVRLLFSCW